MSDFRYDVRRLQDKPVAVLSLSGNLASIAAHRLNEALGVLIDSDVTHLVVDMVRVGYVNSEGWRILLIRARELDEKNGEMRLADMATDLESVFRTLGLAELIPHHDDLEEALQATLESLASSSRLT